MKQERYSNEYFQSHPSIFIRIPPTLPLDVSSSYASLCLWSYYFSSYHYISDRCNEEWNGYPPRDHRFNSVVIYRLPVRRSDNFKKPVPLCSHFSTGVLGLELGKCPYFFTISSWETAFFSIRGFTSARIMLIPVSKWVIFLSVHPLKLCSFFHCIECDLCAYRHKE